MSEVLMMYIVGGYQLQVSALPSQPMKTSSMVPSFLDHGSPFGNLGSWGPE
jgi:uncharacterized membrane protein YqhA